MASKIVIFTAQFLFTNCLSVYSASAVSLLDGKDITTATYFPDKNTIGFGGHPLESTVGPGIEIDASPPGFPIASVDFSDTTIQIDFFRSLRGTVAEFNGWRFYDDNDMISPFTSAILTTTLPGWDISFDEDNIWLNGSGATYLDGSSLIIDIATVPIPPALWLFGAGLLGLSGTARRCRGWQAPSFLHN